jgi:hypothetical protein
LIASKRIGFKKDRNGYADVGKLSNILKVNMFDLY